MLAHYREKKMFLQGTLSKIMEGIPVRNHFCKRASLLWWFARTSMGRTTFETKEKRNTSFLHFIHSFRGVAILFVVGGHILLDWKPGTVSEKILDAIFQNGTVLFVFIAGYLFQHLSGKYDTLDYWKKKVQYVLLPYILISTPAIILRFNPLDRFKLPRIERADSLQWFEFFCIALSRRVVGFGVGRIGREGQ